MSAKVPLYRALSKLGYVSRTVARAIIEAGEISVDGKCFCDPDLLVSIETANIVHKKTLIKPEPLCVIMLYKPRGVITSRKDEQGRATVYSLLPPEFQSLHCVGRLDWATSGLLILTNNTLLSSWLTDPQSAVPRVYVVTVRGLMTAEQAEKMHKGIEDGKQELKSDAVILRKSSNRESHLVMTLTEGKNREVRRLCSSVGHEVTKLKRVSYGALALGSMAPGEYRKLNSEEIIAAFPGISHLVQLKI
jgi:23S rRNA pseudouridine2605 synthase